MIVRYALAGLFAILAFPAIGQTPDLPYPVIPRAVTADPPVDAKYPARFEVIHVPSGGVNINGIVMVAAGRGPHPTFLLFHGLPGNEKNLDLAQAIRRAGWTVVTINYRGSWGSPGDFRFAQNLEDARNTLAFMRDPANAEKLGIDPKRIAIGGHSMGGWVTLETIAADPKLLGAVSISEGDVGGIGKLPRAAMVATMRDNMETLAGVTPESMADEVTAHADDWALSKQVPALKDRRLLVLYGNDFVKSASEQLIEQLKAAGAKSLQTAYVPTDHSWSDRRIMLEALVIDWLQALPAH
ncbi:MAG: alpha/beta fold hydrolase [Alphaproteobacteria bacterium]|nr:alpha/beta fold hydrolase [Alphaproteobacteria bacterium]